MSYPLNSKRITGKLNTDNLSTHQYDYLRKTLISIHSKEPDYLTKESEIPKRVLLNVIPVLGNSNKILRNLLLDNHELYLKLIASYDGDIPKPVLHKLQQLKIPQVDAVLQLLV